jgi:hypothetical protein
MASNFAGSALIWGLGTRLLLQLLFFPLSFNLDGYNPYIYGIYNSDLLGDIRDGAQGFVYLVIFQIKRACIDTSSGNARSFPK